jgi:hypothetical protein
MAEVVVRDGTSAPPASVARSSDREPCSSDQTIKPGCQRERKENEHGTEVMQVGSILITSSCFMRFSTGALACSAVVGARPPRLACQIC